MPEFRWIPDRTLRRKMGGLTSRAVLSTVFLCLVLTLLAWVPAQAQEPTGLRLERAHVSVWPEYDDPRVLILYEGTFADDGGFPRVVEFPVPLGIDVNQAAGVTPDGRYLRQTYQIVAQDGYALLRYELPIPTFFFEYYYDPLEGQTEKSFDWWLRTQYPISNLQIEVQRPQTASGFTVSPAADMVGTEPDGFEYHYVSRPSLGTDEEIKLHISYTKENPDPSVTRAPPMTPAAPPAAAVAQPADQGRSGTVLLVGFLLAAGLLSAGGYWYIRQRRTEVAQEEDEWQPPRRPRRQRPRREEMAAFCHQCGKGLRADDEYCANCGTKRRR